MQVDRFTPSLVNYNKNKLQCAALSNSVNRDYKYFSGQKTAFCGLDLLTSKAEIPRMLKNYAGEIFGTKIKIKGTEELVDAFIAYVPINREIFNSQTIHIFDREGLALGNIKMTYPPKSIDLTATSADYMKLFMIKSFNNKRYSGPGSRLIQSTVEKSMEVPSTKGRLCLLASNPDINAKNDPFVFYHSNGFSIVRPDGTAPDLTGYINSASEQLGLFSTQFIAKIEKLKEQKFESLSPDKKMLAIYETLASEKKCNLNEVALGFSENMYLHDDAVQKIWLPKIEERAIFSLKNKIK